MSKTIVVLLFFIVSLTWGTTWLAMQIAVSSIPPIFATGLRFLFATPILIFIAFISKAPLLFPKGQRFFQFLIGVFYFAIPFTLMIYGEEYVSSGLASVIFSTMPLAIMIASIFILSEKVTTVQLLGLSIATPALTGIILVEFFANKSYNLLGIFAIITAVILHAIMYTSCKKRSCNISIITFNALPCLFASITLIFVGWLIEKPDLNSFSTSSFISVFYLGGVAGVCGILSYFSLQKRAGAFRASLVFLVFPVIAVFLESFIYGHAISHISMILMLPLMIGIFLTLLPTGFNLNRRFIFKDEVLQREKSSRKIIKFRR